MLFIWTMLLKNSEGIFILSDTVACLMLFITYIHNWPWPSKLSCMLILHGALWVSSGRACGIGRQGQLCTLSTALFKYALHMQYLAKKMGAGPCHAVVAPIWLFFKYLLYMSPPQHLLPLKWLAPPAAPWGSTKNYNYIEPIHLSCFFSPWIGFLWLKKKKLAMQHQLAIVHGKAKSQKSHRIVSSHCKVPSWKENHKRWNEAWIPAIGNSCWGGEL